MTEIISNKDDISIIIRKNIPPSEVLLREAIINHFLIFNSQLSFYKTMFLSS